MYLHKGFVYIKENEMCYRLLWRLFFLCDIVLKRNEKKLAAKMSHKTRDKFHILNHFNITKSVVIEVKNFNKSLKLF